MNTTLVVAEFGSVKSAKLYLDRHEQTLLKQWPNAVFAINTIDDGSVHVEVVLNGNTINLIGLINLH